jgi:PTS system cellobiose-specific IIC component
MTSTKQSFAQKLNAWTIKFSNNVIIKTIGNGFARLLPVTMVGTVCTLLGGIPFTPWTNFLASSGISTYLTLGDTVSNGLISVYLVAALSYEMAGIYKKNQISAIAVSMVGFFLLIPITAFVDPAANGINLSALGSRGMFIAMISALLGTFLYCYFMDHGIKIKMHPSVPAAISNSFESLFPIIATAGIFLVINAIFKATPFGDASNAIYTILQKPLEGASSNLATMLIICLIGEGFWWFGIHGSNVTGAVTATLYMPLAVANAQALATGEALPYILNSYFLNLYKGPRHFVLAAMLLWLAKSKHLKSVGKVAIVPGVFGISEPMKFGIPMIYNPLILIPMALSPVISIAIAYFATVIGFLPRVGLNIPWSMPPIISGFIAGGIPGALIHIIQMVAIFFLYLPFFKLLDKQKIQQEESQEVSE